MLVECSGSPFWTRIIFHPFRGSLLQKNPTFFRSSHSHFKVTDVLFSTWNILYTRGYFRLTVLSPFDFDILLTNNVRHGFLSDMLLSPKFSLVVQRYCKIYWVTSRSNGAGINYSNLRCNLLSVRQYVSATLTPGEVSACLQYRMKREPGT